MGPVLQIAGLTLLMVAAFLAWVPLGFAAAGASLVFLGVAFADIPLRRPRDTEHITSRTDEVL